MARNACGSICHRDWELKLKDEEFMLKAIELGERGRLTSAPNPWVGCVIVTEYGDIIGRGFHAKAGEGHAEANAVRDAKESGNEHLLKNSIVYSTLEPCHPFEGKRTPPCDNLLVEHGVKRVVIALVDEDKNVGNKGIEYLKSQGIEVVVGICHEQAFNSLRPYLHHRRTGKPLVVAKIASSIDGRVGCEDYTSQWITGETARSHAHSTWRGTVGHAGAVLVGAGTAIKDRPRLTVRSSQPSATNTNEQREVKQPLRIVIDGRGSVNDPTTPLIAQGGTDGEARTLIATTEAADPKSVEVWRNAGVEIWTSKNSRSEGKIDLEELLLDLGRRGILHVLIEGGPNVLGQFLEKNLVDRVVLYVGACLIGGSGIGWPSVTLATTIKDAKFWKLNECKVLGNDVCMVYDKQYSC
jgi:diaminohydroxyphosphoribosylaminopyrimidine deaminase/5-amino-6-(5-phosphoribosylamino)uracil reductase